MIEKQRLRLSFIFFVHICDQIDLSFVYRINNLRKEICHEKSFGPYHCLYDYFFIFSLCWR